MASRVTRLRSDKHASNITKRGLPEAKPDNKNEVKKTIVEKEESRLSPFAWAFLFFVVFGSSFFGLLEMLKRKL